MGKWIKPARVRAALAAMAQWRETAKTQAAMHLWPLLALLEKGVNKETPVKFEESDDRDFWDRHFRLPGDERERVDSAGKFTEGFYVDPLVLAKKPSDYYHRSPATIRDRTFLNSWKAATLTDKGWVLAKNFGDIFQRRVLSRSGEIHRVPVVDLAVWIFREAEFTDDASAKTLEEKFQESFKIQIQDYDRLFEFEDEDPEQIYAEEKSSQAELREAIENSLVSGAALEGTANQLQQGPTVPDPLLSDDDPILIEVQRLLGIGSSGIIFRGCPGSGKTWYAKQVARILVDDDASRIFEVQFHPSYGYEDFVEGYRPDEGAKSGFKLVPMIFLDACQKAVDGPVVFIIDEINRGDPARIFGELLTYIEIEYRGRKFSLPYTGIFAAVPRNLIVLGTMNQHDKSITQLDLALVRRFDHIDLLPSTEAVEGFLEKSGEFTAEQIDRIAGWFDTLQKLLPFGIGHAYFKDVGSREDLQVIWKYRMLPYCQSVLELETMTIENVKKSFDGMYKAITGKHAEGEIT